LTSRLVHQQNRGPNPKVREPTIIKVGAGLSALKVDILDAERCSFKSMYNLCTQVVGGAGVYIIHLRLSLYNKEARDYEFDAAMPEALKLALRSIRARSSPGKFPGLRSVYISLPDHVERVWNMGIISTYFRVKDHRVKVVYWDDTRFRGEVYNEPAPDNY
jgi:hypothetical protein